MNTKGLLRKKLREGTTNGIIYLFLLLMSVVWIFPFVYLIVTSFRGESTGIVAYFFPKQCSLSNYIYLFAGKDSNFTRWYLNTLVIALALDQYFYGRMDHRTGCGPEPLYIRKRLCSAEEIETAIRDLVSGKYDSKAREISQKIMQENGVTTAAEVIEKYVSEGWA